MPAPSVILPPPNVPWIDKTSGLPALAFRPLKTIIDALQHLTGNNAVLIAVATPTNANAATAGVAVGQLYRDTADPAKVYIRTA
jgi:hypothetical protein